MEHRVWLSAVPSFTPCRPCARLGLRPPSACFQSVDPSLVCKADYDRARKVGAVLTKLLRDNLQHRLSRFFQDVTRSRANGGDPVMAVASTTGPHRDDNQDRVAVAVLRFPQDQRPRMQIAILCDGMGGLTGGAAAASEAMGAFVSVMALFEGTLEQGVQQGVHAANRAVHRRLHGEGGTTLTAVVSTSREAWCAHVGDSRLYSYGTDGLRLLTQDDTIHGAIQAHGGGGDEDVLDNRLLQFVGIGDGLTPHIQKLHPRDDHLWILTSDGAHGLGRKVLESLLESSRNADDVVRRMIFVADALNVRDNASIAAVRQAEFLDRSEEFGGTTLLISSPFRSLEVWLSETFVGDDQREPRPGKRDMQPVDETPATSAVVEDKVETQGPRRKARASRSRSKARASRPLEVLFESEKADDRPS